MMTEKCNITIKKKTIYMYQNNISLWLREATHIDMLHTLSYEKHPLFILSFMIYSEIDLILIFETICANSS